MMESRKEDEGPKGQEVGGLQKMDNAEIEKAKQK